MDGIDLWMPKPTISLVDINQANFYPRLLSVLGAIASSTFVSIDLEMSGISNKQNPSGMRRSLGKPDLQALYEDTKSAAEKYQVLQLGITCVEEDRKLGTYIARPFNINISPLFLQKDKFGIHRDIVLSSSAVQFLLDHKFDMGSVFTGTTYLSRAEVSTVRQNFKSQQVKANIAIRTNDNAARSFYNNVRQSIKQWVKSNDFHKKDYLNIEAPDNAMTSFQRRLVHQLVRSEFPEYRAHSRADGQFMQIQTLDQVQEDRVNKQKSIQLEDAIARQRGVAYVFEALAGGDISGLERSWFYTDEDGNEEEKAFGFIDGELARLQESLRTRRPMIVGHNLFTDLVYLTKMFTGSLPDQAIDFKKTLRALFPMIIDTKYMATESKENLQGESSLDHLWDTFIRQEKPRIQLHEKHMLYGSCSRSHEAGYDSWTTAQLFVKLSASLENDTLETETESESESAKQLGTDEELIKPAVPIDNIPLNPPDTNIAPPASVEPIKTRRTRRRSKTTKTTKVIKSVSDSQVLVSSSRYSSQNAFSLLDTQDSDDASSQSGGASLSSSPAKSQTSAVHQRQRTTSTASLMDEDILDDLSGHAPPDYSAMKTAIGNEDGLSTSGRSDANGAEETERGDARQWIPEKNNPFWLPYRDKLRVFGAHGGICDLRDQDMSPKTGRE